MGEYVLSDYGNSITIGDHGNSVIVEAVDIYTARASMYPGQSVENLEEV